MHENFLALQREKRDRIINAAMQEFSSRGFKNASTNEIVKQAGISKGALFHYFVSKRDLFEFIYLYSIEQLSGVMESGMKNLPKDIFERWKSFALLKMKIRAQHSQIFDFTVNMAQDEDAGVKKFLEGLRERLSFDYMKKMYQGIDAAKFKPGVDFQKAAQIITWVAESFATAKLKNIESTARVYDENFFTNAVRELEEYLVVLKKNFYTEDNV